MASKPKRIRDLRARAGNHPNIRQGILRDGLAPFVVCDSVGAYWDRSRIVDKDGTVYSSTSSDRIFELIKMVLLGAFGEEMKDVLLDPDRFDKIYDDLVDRLDPGVIARDSLHVFGTKSAPPATTSPQRNPERKVTPLGPTTGPVPISWSGAVERNAAQTSSTYVFQFGERDLWKIGHAVDLAARLAEVNKHVPHEVLGEHWHLTLQESWPSERDAYDMEQRLLGALRTPSSVGERVTCTRLQLQSTWTSMLIQK